MNITCINTTVVAIMRQENTLYNYCSERNWVEVLAYLQSDAPEEEKKRQIQYKHRSHGNTLNCACFNDPPLEVVKQLLDIGGRDIIFETMRGGYSPLHVACGRNISYEVIHLLLEVGGKDLTLMQTEGDLCTALHHACFTHNDVNVIKLLVEIGGKQLALIESKYRRTAMNFSNCRYKNDIECVLIVQEYLEYIPTYNSSNRQVADEILDRIFACELSFRDIYRLLRCLDLPEEHRRRIERYKNEKLIKGNFIKVILQMKPSIEKVNSLINDYGLTKEQTSHFIAYREELIKARKRLKYEVVIGKDAINTS